MTCLWIVLIIIDDDDKQTSFVDTMIDEFIQRFTDDSCIFFQDVELMNAFKEKLMTDIDDIMLCEETTNNRNKCLCYYY